MKIKQNDQEKFEIAKKILTLIGRNFEDFIKNCIQKLVQERRPLSAELIAQRQLNMGVEEAKGHVENLSRLEKGF